MTNETTSRRLRLEMVETQLRARNITDPAVLEAMEETPREAFAEHDDLEVVYSDRPLPISAGQTISQPYIVAYMLQLAQLGPDDLMLEVGSGSGYAAAVASRICRAVIGIEQAPELVDRSRVALEALGIDNVTIELADGTMGDADHAPFDAIVVSAAGPSIPSPLLDQLADGGRLVAPIGPRTGTQTLAVARRSNDRIVAEHHGAVAFVPLIGQHGWRPE